MHGSRHQHLFKENVRITKKRFANFENKGSGVVYDRDGISTPRARLKGWQPLIECAKMQLQYYLFYFFIFFIFLGSTRVLLLLLRILKCDEKFIPT